MTGYVFYLTLFLLASGAHAWEEYELELFDLVDEVNQNFYEFFGIKKDASSSDVRKAYRQMSLIWHPDKSKEENAEEKFRQIVAVYEVLKDEVKRKRYNEVLEFGLPDWKQPLFYYRRVRKMGLLELAILLFGIITFGHYLVVWSVYWERRLTVEDILSSKKRKKKGGKHADKDDLLQEAFEQIPKPKFTDLVPFQLCRLLYASIIGFPGFCVQLKLSILAAIQENLKKRKEVVEEPEPVEKERKKKRKKVYEIPDLTNGTLDGVDLDPQLIQNLSGGAIAMQDVEEGQGEGEDDSFPARWGEKWTPAEYSTLANKMIKFPGGINQRWEKIAREMERTVAEVTAAAKKMKEGGYALVNVADDDKEEVSEEPEEEASKNDDQVQQEQEEKVEEVDEDEKRLEELGKTCRNWNQIQQKSLEAALKQFPKGTLDRWDRIAKCVPSKEKEECIQRYKYICELVKMKSKQR